MTEEFDKQWSSLNLDDEDLRELQEQILIDPQKGNVVPGTGGLRKIRFQYHKKGKRGGIRVLYVDIVVVEKIYLITAYSKGDIENVNEAQKKQISNMVESLKKSALKKR